MWWNEEGILVLLAVRQDLYKRHERGAEEEEDGQLRCGCDDSRWGSPASSSAVAGRRGPRRSRRRPGRGLIPVTVAAVAAAVGTTPRSPGGRRSRRSPRTARRRGRRRVPEMERWPLTGQRSTRPSSLVGSFLAITVTTTGNPSHPRSLLVLISRLTSIRNRTNDHHSFGLFDWFEEPPSKQLKWQLLLTLSASVGFSLWRVCRNDNCCWSCLPL